MTITTNNNMTRTTRQMIELQRDSFETLAKNFAALQRRNVELTQKWITGFYRPFFPFTYATYAQEGLQAAQQGTEQALEATQQALEATQQVAQQALRVAEEATAMAEKATVKAEEAAVKAEKAEQATTKSHAATREAALRDEEETREVALQAAVHRLVNTKDYEELNVDEVSKKLDGLSATELKKVREYETHNKNRETLIAEIDRRLEATH
jgi:hypothetical protein